MSGESLRDGFDKQLDALIVFFVITLVGTVSLWALDITGLVDNVLLSGVDRHQYFGALAADLFAMPLLAACIVGLVRRRRWALFATQVEMGAWIYSSVLTLVMVLSRGWSGLDVFAIVWGPIYIVVAVYAVWLTWRTQARFL
jgi:hypothetical protein